MSCQDAGISLFCIFWMRQGLVWLLVCCRDNTVAALWLSQVGNQISSPKIICLTVRACWVPDGPCIRHSPLSQCCFSPGPQMSLDTTRCTCWWLLASHSTLHHPPDTSHGKAPVSPSPAQATSGMTQICVLMEEPSLSTWMDFQYHLLCSCIAAASSYVLWPNPPQGFNLGQMSCENHIDVPSN